MLHSYRLPGSVLLILAGVGVACGGESLVGPDSGTLEVTSSTVGVEVDADGYTIEIDGGAGQPLAPNVTLRHPEVAAGPHTVLLTGIATNCTVGGDNPRFFTITPGQTAAITFAVVCGATTGSLRITSTTTGSSPDADGYTVTLDGSSRGTIAPTGETTIDGLTPGDAHTVGLGGISGNCQVEGENPRPLAITAGSTAEAAFAVACQAPPANTGTIQITTATSGPGTDADGYGKSVV